MLVRDEADIIERSVRHLLSHVDAVFVMDNRSTDGTHEILHELAAEYAQLRVKHDDEIGYYQSAKMTSAAREIRERFSFSWVVPCDADELWYGPGGMRVGDYLDSLSPDVQVAEADLYNYLPVCWLPPADPFTEIQWRQAAPGALPKIACRLAYGLQILAGNHNARYGSSRINRVRGLTVRHFSWRTPEQYVRKIRNGLEAYAATDLDPAYGAHWRMFEGATNEEIEAHFREWFCKDDPVKAELVHDPAEVWSVSDAQSKLGA